jgi:hypothetical protein
MPIATETLAEPNVLPTTVGIVAKKPPFEAPLITTNTARGASVVDFGHSVRMLTAVRIREQKSVLIDPSLSQSSPQIIRPIAEEKLNPASKAAPVLDDSPIDRLYRGMKKGGTNKGNVPMAPTRKTSRKLVSLKRRLHDVSSPHRWSLRDLPFYQTGGSDRSAFSNKPSRWKSGDECRDTKNTICPSWAETLDQSI